MGRKGRSAQRSNGTPSQRWENVPATNDAFVKYYQSLGIIESTPESDGLSEWDKFMSVMRTDLPTTFRVTGNKSSAHELNHVIRSVYVPFLSNVQYNGQVQPEPKTLPWYPQGLAWTFTVPKQVIRKVAEFKRFQNFLVFETEAGNISRQEAVSMIPSLLLDVESHHCVLDTCAAPGSKTAQLLEALHTSPCDDSNNPSTFIPTGVLVANDSDYKRAQLLVHQSLRRLPSPSMMVTNLDASLFPNLKVPAARFPPESTDTAPNHHIGLKFDRILCDVPCSGDGTMRKNMTIWRDWNVANAMGLHPLQLRILNRAIGLLRPGGRLVYSTCSLNPAENESVVSAALAQHPNMRLVDVSERLPGLIRRPGLLQWKVWRRDLSEELISPDTASADHETAKRFPRTLWPDGQEEARGLTRCLRIYPHLQDTGGFFVAVMEKVPEASIPTRKVSVRDAIELAHPDRSTLPSSEEPSTVPRVLATGGPLSLVPERSPPATVKRRLSPGPSPSAGFEVKKVRQDDPRGSSQGGAVPPPTVSMIPQPQPEDTEAKRSPNDHQHKTAEGERPFKEEPYTFLPSDDPQVKACREFFALNDDFPSSTLLVRNAAGQPQRTIYLTSPLVRDLVQANAYTNIRLVCCGVKLFARQDNTRLSDDLYVCKWRVVSDGTAFFRPFMGSRRILRCGLQSLKQLLDGNQPYPQFQSLSETRFRTAVEDMTPGSCVAEIEPEEWEGAILRRPLMVGVWRSATSINAMIEKKDRSALSLRLWGVDITRPYQKGDATSGAPPQAKLIDKTPDSVM